MLETIREYGLDRLEQSGEADTVRRRLTELLIALAESANLMQDAEGPQRFDLVVPESDNLRSALQWASTNNAELGLRLAIACEVFWVTRPFEGARWLETLLAGADSIPGRLRAAALRVLGGVIFIVGRFDEGARLYDESLAEYRTLGDQSGIATLLLRLAHYALARGELERARSLTEESSELYGRLGSRRGQAQAMSTFGQIEFDQGNRERGLELMENGARLAREVGFAWWSSGMYVGLGERACELGRWDDADSWAREGLAEAHGIGERQWAVYGLAVLARAAAATGRLERAGRLWGAIEAEEGRGPLGQWEKERDVYAVPINAAANDLFEIARREGRRLSLEDALVVALADS
jgi:non-specific serine/threonine protein kinase